MLGPTLLRHGTEDQKRRFMPGLLSGELAFCQLFSEPGAGSDLAGLSMRAERDGDEFVVNGQKVWNSQAQFCDWGFLLVRTNPDAPKHRGITFLLVQMATPGIEARPLVQMNGSAHFNEVFFDDVRIPVANVVGEIDGGWAPARTVLLNESAFIGDRKGTSVMSPLSELARRHGLLDDPLVCQRLADAWARERMQRWMGETIQNAVRRGGPPPIDPRRHEAVRGGVEAPQRGAGNRTGRPGRGGRLGRAGPLGPPRADGALRGIDRRRDQRGDEEQTWRSAPWACPASPASTATCPGETFRDDPRSGRRDRRRRGRSRQRQPGGGALRGAKIPGMTMKPSMWRNRSVHRRRAG